MIGLFIQKEKQQVLEKKIKDLQANASRPTINKTTNDSGSVPSSSNRLPLPNPTSKGPIVSSSSSTTTTKQNVSSNNPINRPTTNDERNQLENDIVTSVQNPLSDERMQQLSDMLDKLTNTISQSEKI